MPRSSCVFLVVFFVVVATKYHVKSSSPNYPPSASPSFLPSTSLSKTTSGDVLQGSSSASLNNDESPRKNADHPSRPPKSSSVTFLYELYEHEIYNPKTGSWTSRRFTQSPITGGGGRDSTSLNPQSCSPPRNYLFDGEWKIDMASESRDGFGWEYYVGKYDGLGRRRRRWVRALKRVSSGSVSAKGAAAKRTIDKKNKKKSTKGMKTHHPGLIRALRDQYNFKGFGWSFYKSFVLKKAVGASFRIPLSANFDSYDKHLAAPYISSSTYFGYPWMIATFLSASVPTEVVKWLVGGVVWKIQWGLAVASALIRGVAEAAIWIMFWPWRLWRSTVQVMGILASRVGTKEFEETTVTSPLIDSINEAMDGDVTQGIIDSGDVVNVTIDTHIQINNSSEYIGNGEISAPSATAVMDSPRGGSSSTTQVSSSFRKKYLTISGDEIPTFHRTTSIKYSSTIQERIGMCISWRISQERGYEYRCHFVYTCLPTLLFWIQLEEERKVRIKGLRQFIGVWGKSNEVDKIRDTEASRSESKSLSGSRSKSQSKSTFLSSFLSEHSSTLGISSGFPLPVDPYFSFSLMLSLSAFYYGWLLKYMRSLFILPSQKTLQHNSKEKELSQAGTVSSADDDSVSASTEKLVSSALKKKRPLEENSADIHNVSLVGSEIDNCTDAELNVAGV